MSRTAIRGLSGSSSCWPTANIITDYRTPDRLRFGLSPLTTRFTDVWTAVAAARDIIEAERGGSHG